MGAGAGADPANGFHQFRAVDLVADDGRHPQSRPTSPVASRPPGPVGSPSPSANPVCYKRNEGPLAQRLEQSTHNRLVAGSNPAGATTLVSFRQNPLSPQISLRDWRSPVSVAAFRLPYMSLGVHVAGSGVVGAGGLGGVAHGAPVKSKKSSRSGWAASRCVSARRCR